MGFWMAHLKMVECMSKLGGVEHNVSKLGDFGLFECIL